VSSHVDRLHLEIPLASDDELRALRGALLAARAGELAEIQRRSGRHALQYGTDSARESMTDEVANLRCRWEMLDRLIGAIDAATMTGPTGPATSTAATDRGAGTAGVPADRSGPDPGPT